MAAKSKSNFSSSSLMICIIALILSLLFSVNESAPQAFRSGRGQPQWHHNAFHDVRDSIRSDVSRMLHSRAEVPFQVPLEVNIVLIGFSGDGGYRYSVDYQKLEEFLRVSFPSHRPSGLETREPLDIEHRIVYNVFPAGQAEMIALEKAVKENMIPAGTSREAELGMEVDSFLVDAKAVEPVFQKLYSFIFDMDNVGQSAEDLGRPLPSAIFVVNFDKVRMDPRNKAIDLDSLMYGHIKQLNDEEMKKQEGGYVYRYQYNGGGATQVWLSSGRFVVIDLSAGPCTYGKIETEEGSVGIRTMPRLQKIFSNGRGTETEHYTHDIFMGHISSIISTIVEHVIAPDVRFETVDMMTRLLIPIIVLQNHNRYNIMEKGHNYSINVEAIEAEVKKMVHHGQEVVIGGGSHSLHRHEKLAIALSKSMRGHSLQEMERSADVLAAGLLEMSDPSLSSRCYLRQHWMDDFDGTNDSILKHKPIWATYDSKRGKKNKRVEKREGDLHRTYGTRVIPVFVLSLADVDPKLMMEDDSLVWTSKDVVVVLEHQTEKIALSYVSEKERKYAYPYQVQRHILAGLASSVGGLCAPYEKASHAHERPVINWLWASGCHRFGPFCNTSQVSQMLQDVALVRTFS